MADNDPRSRGANPSSSTQPRRSPKLEFTIVNDIQGTDDRARQNDAQFQQTASADFAPMMIPIDPMLTSPELSYMMGYQGMPPGYSQSRPFPTPMDYAAPVYNQYLGMALEEQHRMAGLGAAPFPGNPLMYLPGTFHPLATQQYSMYSGNPNQNKPAPPPPPVSHVPGRRPQNLPETTNPQHREHSRDTQQRDNRGESYLDRRIDVPDRTIMRHDELRSRDPESTTVRYRTLEPAHTNEPYNTRYDHRDRGPEFGLRPRNDEPRDRKIDTSREHPRPVEDYPRHVEDRPRPNETRPRHIDDRERTRPNDERTRSIDNYPRHIEERSRQVEDRRPRHLEDHPTRYTEDRPRQVEEHPRDLGFRHVEERHRDLNLSDYDRLRPRRDSRQRSLSPQAIQASQVRASTFDPRHSDDRRYEPRFDRRERDKSIDAHHGREYGRPVERYNRDLRDERTALTGRAQPREPAPSYRPAAVSIVKDVVTNSTIERVTVYQSLHSRENPPSETSADKELPPKTNVHMQYDSLTVQPAAVKISSPEEGEISLKAQAEKINELLKPADPRRPSLENVPEAESKSHSKDSMTSKTESEPTRMLFCRNLPKTWSESKLREIFGRFGEILEMNLTHLKSRGIGFIRFYDIRAAMTAKHRFDGNSQKEFGSDGTWSVHFSKSEEEKNASADCTVDHHQVIPTHHNPILTMHHQGTLLVRLTRKEETNSMKRKISQFLSNYGPIRAKHNASIIGKQGLLVEFYDARHCAAAFVALNRTNMRSLVLRLSLEWDIPYAEELDDRSGVSSVRAPMAPRSASITSTTGGFFIDVHGDDRKRRLSSGSVDIEEIIGRSERGDVVMERVEKFPPEQPKISTHVDPSGDTSSPILLQQMSSLLSSLQKNQTEPRQKNQTEPPQKKPTKSEPKPKSPLKPKSNVMSEVPAKAAETTAVVSSGGVVSADRMKKAPTLESVQQLAKLLLQQTRDT